MGGQEDIYGARQGNRLAWGEEAVRDESVAPDGWPKEQRSRRMGKISKWHDAWAERRESASSFRPSGRKEGSDYNQHFVDVEAPIKHLNDFDRRAAEIDGCDPDTRRSIPDPDPGDRFRGAVLAAVVGDAFERGVAEGVVGELSWKPALNYFLAHLGKADPLTEYVFTGSPVGSSSFVQLMSFTVEGLIRAHVARRMNPVDDDPAPEVQHAYQRWLYLQRDPQGERFPWSQCGGPFAARTARPDGWLVESEALLEQQALPAATVRTLEEFARTGAQRGPSPGASGGSVLPRAALAAVWSNEAAGAFAAGVAIARLTHGRPDDYLPAGFAAALLHQQIRDVPFSGCLEAARDELLRWPDHERTAQMISAALELNKEVRSPTMPGRLAATFPGGGADGAEALAIALYCALASDYVREALLLAVNYAQGRSAVCAISGLIIGAECGVNAIPSELRRVPSLYPLVDELVTDALTEFSPAAPTDASWTQRYPAW
ncbi:ADP-ribosylglycohydrolase family protein [Saccharopolyspora sp. NFXS83]|uniref:ADP-ribosylglycohydrolase family protein n=1 Tax=Saccharopolyspora sp. NFXS83 TaxID=2993560 RepID=UPI00224AF7ED|nr:ADP-ribosylglycohydrolase family protein [Saccharopolyspora sp. NFXS83]MCX2728998.1 ADP-ribosylglycohydrolase family protein [Saccharopolyspora sp. NFXS83]